MSPLSAAGQQQQDLPEELETMSPQGTSTSERDEAHKLRSWRAPCLNILTGGGREMKLHTCFIFT